MQKMAKNTHQSSDASRRKDGGAKSAAGLSSKKSPWYQRAVEVLLLVWKQPAASSSGTTKAAAASGVTAASSSGKGAGCGPGRLRKSSSLNVAASFTRVCLCAPISSYNSESLYCGFPDAAPRRSYSYPRASSASGVSPLVAPPPAAEQQLLSGRGRSPGAGGGGGGSNKARVFRGKSLTDDILMRRFVVDEEATRRRNEMEVIRRRHAAASKRRRLGPSPLRRMARPESESEADVRMETDKPAAPVMVQEIEGESGVAPVTHRGVRTLTLPVSLLCHCDRDRVLSSLLRFVTCACVVCSGCFPGRSPPSGTARKPRFGGRRGRNAAVKKEQLMSGHSKQLNKQRLARKPGTIAALGR
ncbi:hypothetical protein PR202_ga19815 [Eleusine coracana subsp. coracana]|uniref:Uncharacterized protein n=1 Tax=Eleusine coracana subsp. coracana TaxID=191504 RepID=A0AAV5CVI5_ELECO|nr:hypothetical protein PR202_ga19815 [Eleusine coracana subsp. coracana]